MSAKIVFSSIVVCAAAFACRANESADFTKEVRLDTIGTRGFNIQRTISDRVVGSPDPILTARESIAAQTGLCPRKYDVLKITIVNHPPTLTYEASLRCW